MRLGLGLGLSSSSVAAWTPADLFTDGTFGWFYDPADYTAGNLPASAGSAPALTQANGALQPSSATDADTGATYLDISAKWLASTADQTLTFPFYMAAAVRRDTSSAGMFMAFGTASTNKLALSDSTNFSRHNAEYRDANGQRLAIGEGGSAPLSTITIVELLHTGAALQVAINGSDWSTATTITPEAATINSARIGINITGAASGSTIASGRFYGGFGLAREPTVDERANIIRKLKQMSGLIVYDTLSYDVFATGGQSNMVGSPGTAGDTPTDWGTAAEYINGGALKALRDPVRSGGTILASGLAADGSLLPAFGKEFHTQTGRYPLIVGGAVSGQGLTNGGWNTSGTLLEEIAAKTAAAVAHVESVGGSVTFRGMLWLGGEADANAGVAKATFKAAFIDLLSRARTEFESAFTSAGCSASAISQAAAMEIFALSIDRTDNPANDAAFLAIREAISEACTETAGMHLVMPYQDFHGAGLLRDETIDIHWVQSALNSAGQIAAGNVATALGL